LDVDSPFPPPSPESVGKHPKTVPYNTHQLKYRYYGRNVELLIARAISEQDDNEKRILVAHIARLMKTFYQNWNREVVDDEVIWGHIIEISEGLLRTIVQAISGNSSLGNLRNNNTSNNRPSSTGDTRGGDTRRTDGRNDGRSNAGGRQSFGGRNDGVSRTDGARNNNDSRGGRTDNNRNNNNNGGRPNDNRSGGRSNDTRGNDNNRNRR
jgi:DNA-binding protein Fis